MHYRIYIKMELLTPLLNYASPYAPEQMARRIGIDICKALELRERRQIVHRDIKPQNLFILWNLLPKSGRNWPLR